MEAQIQVPVSKADENEKASSSTCSESHSSFKRIDNGAFPSSISEIAAVAGESGRKTEAQDAEKCSVPEGTCNNQNSPRTGEQRVTGARLHILSTAFSIATFMVAIDRTILANAIPRITSHFHSLDNIAWYGSAYLLTQMSLQPSFGRVYVYFESKSTYLASLFVFEVGSIICATAPSSQVLIFGRAVAGAGSAGMLTGSLAIYGQVVPLRQRPAGMALITAMYALAGLLGPTLGGVFTDAHQLTWRFCFWINLPFGAIAAIIIIYILDRKPGPHEDLPMVEKLIRLDPLGATLLSSSLICLFLALQWGGNELPWSSPKVWGCLVGFGILTVLFSALQAIRKEKATIPLRILTQRTVALSCIISALYGMAVITHSYYLPIYFQAVKGTSAVISGVYGLPFTIVSAVGTICVGFLMTAYGYYVPFMWIGSVVYLAGSVIYYLLQIDSGAGKWVGCQLVAGVGFGIGVQVTFIAVQVVTRPEDMPTACSWEVFFKSLGGAVGISVAQTIFSDVLLSRLQEIPGLDAMAVVNSGAADVSTAQGGVPAALVGKVKLAYNDAITRAFIVPVAVTALAVILTLGMERRHIEKVEEDPLLNSTPESVEVHQGSPK